MIQHQIEALAAAGVTDVVLAVNYRPEIMAEALKTVRLHTNSAAEQKITEFLVREAIQCHHHLLRRDRASRHRRSSQAC